MLENMTPFTHKIINVIGLVFCITMNALAGQFSEYNIGEVSDLNPVKFVPAGGAFSIWGIIYTLLIIVHICDFVPKEEDVREKKIVCFLLFIVSS